MESGFVSDPRILHQHVRYMSSAASLKAFQAPTRRTHQEQTCDSPRKDQMQTGPLSEMCIPAVADEAPWLNARRNDGHQNPCTKSAVSIRRAAILKGTRQSTWKLGWMLSQLVEWAALEQIGRCLMALRRNNAGVGLRSIHTLIMSRGQGEKSLGLHKHPS